MNEDDKAAMTVSFGFCGCLLFAFAAVVFIAAAATKWVIS